MDAPRLILASRSPRRIELLGDAGYAFGVEPADVDEDDVPSGLDPRGVATCLAKRKARAVADRFADAVVLGADTVVAVGPTRYGKADTPDAARTMLVDLAGNAQRVITGVAVWSPDRTLRFDAAESVVEMRRMSDAEIDAYVASDHWRGKAGAYGIQDVDPDDDPFVRIVEGEYDNVVGLPMAVVRRLLDAVGVRPAGAMR